MKKEKVIVDYKIVSEKSSTYVKASENLQDSVSKELKDRWQPYGFPFVFGVHLLQPMVKYSEE